MSYEEMMNNMIKKFGFENEDTIEFCHLVEYVHQENNAKELRALVEGFYTGLIRG